ncbi:MAG: ABC transporter substrate-binding protein, partial [Acidobacteriota bacterium]
MDVKRKSTLILPAVLLLWTLACSLMAPPRAFSADAEAHPGNDWLIYHLPGEPATLNQITATDAYESTVNSFIYESLIRRDETSMELVPQLAESWEIADDHLTYTFHLKKNVRWHDGEPFTARDIAFSFDRIRDPKVDAAHLRNYYQDIENLEVLDDYTVRYHYKTPYFRALEFCGGIPIMPS